MSDMHEPILPKPACSPADIPPELGDPPDQSPPIQAVTYSWNWLRRFFAANPFYFASAALLLYGIYRVSGDRAWLTTEVKQLLFNFSSIQFYELTLVALAVVLARRMIWYDSTLLVLLENTILIVPFILVSQAGLIEQGWIYGFCAAGIALALIRVGAIKKLIAVLNLPGRALAMGGLLLVVNSLLPILYRHFQETRMGRSIASGSAYWMNEWSWLVILPLLIGCAALLPAPQSRGTWLPQRRWLPAAMFMSWIVATGVHLYCLSYVYTFELRAGLIAPVLLALAWTLRNRLPDFVEQPGAVLRGVLLLVPLPAALLAACSRDTAVVGALAGVNLCLYGIVAWRGDQRRWAIQLALASLMMLLLAIPGTFTGTFHTQVPDGVAVKGLLLGYLMLAALVSRRPKLSVVGAIATAILVGSSVHPVESAMHWAWSGALTFLLLHSLRWDVSEDPSAVIVRRAVAGVWAGHAWVWVGLGGPALGMAALGFGVVAVWFGLLWLGKQRLPVVVPVAAAAVILSGPLVSGGRAVLAAPVGLLAVAASFLLLAMGTALALTKHRWHRAQG